MEKIGIIGGGFSGTMAAVHLIKNAKEPVEISIIEEKEVFNKGIAYNPYSKLQLLNVMAARMSAFADKPDDFVNWVLNRKQFNGYDKELVGNSYLPRYLYGNYIVDIWKDAEKEAAKKNIKINVIHDYVIDLENTDKSVTLWLFNDKKINVDKCIIATGNAVPGNTGIKNMNFYKSASYFQNPWKEDSVTNVDKSKPVLIIGNGLTMVDTVIGLLEKGFDNDIYSISPNGFNILPHRHNGLKYSKLVEELPEIFSLNELVSLFNKHIKIVRTLGISAEPLIDSIRPYTQKIWQSLSNDEKRKFMFRLRHLWGVARHRIPLHIHDRLQQLRVDSKLHIISGKINDIIEKDGSIKVSYYDKKNHKFNELEPGRIINCTGPETDLMKLDKSFLKNCLLKGILTQDDLKLGINADPNSFRIIDKEGNKLKNIYTIGSNLKGIFWESTAVNELRAQAEKLSEILLSSEMIDNTKVLSPDAKDLQSFGI